MGRHLQSYDIVDGYKYCLVVSPNGRYMAVSYCDEHKLRVYRQDADATATLVYLVGSRLGVGPKQFNYLCKMC